MGFNSGFKGLILQQHLRPYMSSGIIPSYHIIRIPYFWFWSP